MFGIPDRYVLALVFAVAMAARTLSFDQVWMRVYSIVAQLAATVDNLTNTLANTVLDTAYAILNSLTPFLPRPLSSILHHVAGIVDSAATTQRRHGVVGNLAVSAAVGTILLKYVIR